MEFGKYQMYEYQYVSIPICFTCSYGISLVNFDSKQPLDNFDNNASVYLDPLWDLPVCMHEIYDVCK